jgi:endonuclease/exonuclease/phosphatase family metal-dependent hydrolase
MYRSEETIRQALQKTHPYYFFAPEWVADKHTRGRGLAIRDFGGMVEQGKLILSKYPIVHGYNYFYYKNYEFDCDRANFHEGNDHGRALQVCEINADETIFQLGNVHGSYSAEKKDTERSLHQSKFIIEKLKQKNLPTIILGDFNVLPDTQSIAAIEQKFTNQNKLFNITSTLPNGKMIDYIFLSKEFSAKELSAGNTDISDHYPLIIEI